MNKELEENIEIVKELLEGAKSNDIYEENKYFKSIEKLLNYIDNSISKEVIEEKIKELNEDIEDYLKTDKSGRFTRTNCIFTYKKEALQELLEGK